MVAPALLALALGTLGVIAAPALPEAPRLSLSASDPRWKKPFNVTCTAGRRIPATDFTITADNRTWPATLGRDGRGATAEVTVEREGSVRLGCSARLGGAEIHANATLQVYHLPVPLLDVADTAAAGAELSGRCSVPDGAGSDARVRVRARGRDLGESRRPPVNFSVPVREEDAETGLELACVAEMPPFAARNRSQTIRVLAKPRLDTESCPPQQNWTEGQEETLNCSARGSPRPQVKCSKDGNSFPLGTARRAHRAHAGTYLCQATNELGTAEREVTVWVHYDDSVPLLPVLLGVLPALALLGLAGAFFLHRHSTKIGEYWLWKRQPPPDARPLRPPGSSQAAAAAPNGAP